MATDTEGERRLIISIPEPLRDILGPEGARALADLLNEAAVQTRGDVIEITAERFERRLAEEMAKLRAEIGGLRTEVHEEIGGLRTEVHEEIGGLRTEMRAEIQKLRTEMAGFRIDMSAFESRITRWMFVFWVGQLFAVVGILLAFFRG